MSAHRSGARPPTEYAKRILARGSLDPEEKKPRDDFQDNRVVGDLPELPAGYTMTEWIRSDISDTLSVAIHAMACTASRSHLTSTLHPVRI